MPMQWFNGFMILKPKLMEFWTQHSFYFAGLEEQTFYQYTGDSANFIWSYHIIPFSLCQIEFRWFRKSEVPFLDTKFLKYFFMYNYTIHIPMCLHPCFFCCHFTIRFHIKTKEVFLDTFLMASNTHWGWKQARVSGNLNPLILIVF